jgi:serine/threonine-protein kinase
VLTAGQTLNDRYEIHREIGRGSYGVVYLVRDQATGETLAVKVLHPWADADEAIRRRLQREAKLTGMLNSPSAVRVYDLQQMPDGRLFIVMEYLDGRELSEVLRHEGPFRPKRVAQIARQILDALFEAHQLGVIHRDLKPQNIMLCGTSGETDIVKVLDFGIAKVAGPADGGIRESTKLTVQGGVLGTPVYMSPEQCRGLPLTPASDIYSLGVVLYELLTGHPPLDDPNPVRVMMLHHQTPPPPLPPAVGETLIGRAVMRALEKDPARRFASAAEFRMAIDGPVATSPGPPKTAPAASTAGAPGQPAPAGAAEETWSPGPSLLEVRRQAYRGHRSRWIQLAVGAIIVVLLVLLALSQMM